MAWEERKRPRKRNQEPIVIREGFSFVEEGYCKTGGSGTILSADETHRAPEILTLNFRLVVTYVLPKTVSERILFLQSTDFLSGAEGDRTPDLMTASHALSHLSYSPLYRSVRRLKGTQPAVRLSRVWQGFLPR